MEQRPTPSRSHHREAARQLARQQRELAQRKRARMRIIRQSSLVAGALAVIGIIVTVGMTSTASTRGVEPGPANMRSDGLVFTAAGVQHSSALEPKEAPTPLPAGTDRGNVTIVMYVDYMCPFCKAFEAKYGPTIDKLVQSGATLDLHPVAVLNSKSNGTNYSTRAANAFACVADAEPEKARLVNDALFEHQPPEYSTGLTDDELVKIVTDVGVTNPQKLSDCIRKGTFRNWVTSASYRAFSSLPNANVKTLQGTPTVVVNGTWYDANAYGGAFEAFLEKTIG
ncbi:MAG TPA: thioredoxin domain-containing protein [Microbacteriaceae bacterium]|nr:thioredoxin domain-containing protein [Microbacteriaceae bacterium]